MLKFAVTLPIKEGDFIIQVLNLLMVFMCADTGGN